jgi:type I restriction enzyme S subunit
MINADIREDLIQSQVTWKVVRLKDLGNLQNGISKGKDYFGFGFPFVSYGNVYNDTIALEHINGLANSSEEEQKQYSVLEGDVFFTRTSETIDEIGISATVLNTIPKATFSGFVIRLRPSKRLIRKEYSKYFFKAHVNRQILSKAISLVTRASLSQNILNNLPILLPSHKEQAEIASYLDAKTQIIDKKIGLLGKKIGYYHELRKSLINETVTRGLNKNGKLKDSGIDWIGKISEHWQVKRLKALGSIETSSVNKKIEENEELVKLVNYVDVYNNPNKEISSSINFMTVSANVLQVNNKKLKRGDALFTPSSETIEDIGVSAIVMEDLSNTLYSYHLIRLRFSVKINLDFKKYMLNNDYVQYYFSHSATGTTRKIIGLNTIGNLPVLIPPTIEEQKEIANYLVFKTRKIDKIITNIKSQITILKELRKTLINEVVTGQMKVIND